MGTDVFDSAIGLLVMAALSFGIRALAHYAATAKSQKVRNLAALGGQVAREAVLLAEERGALDGFRGAEKLNLAVNLYNERMEAEGVKVEGLTAVRQINAAHKEMTLDKGTAFNEKLPRDPLGAERPE